MWTSINCKNSSHNRTQQSQRTLFPIAWLVQYDFHKRRGGRMARVTAHGSRARSPGIRCSPRTNLHSHTSPAILFQHPHNPTPTQPTLPPTPSTLLPHSPHLVVLELPPLRRPPDALLPLLVLWHRVERLGRLALGHLEGREWSILQSVGRL
jgi:hypothetical protein